MLKRLHVENFRLLRDATIDFNDLTVFIGPNSSGKSTVLEVLDFLSRCSTEKLQDALAAHGGFDSVRTIGTKKPIRLEMHWTFSMDSGRAERRKWSLNWAFELDRAPNGAVLVRSERLVNDLGASEEVIVETTLDGRRLVHPDVAAGSGDEAPATVTSPTSLAFDAIRDDERFPGLSALNLVLGELRVLGSLTAPPAWARPDLAAGSARDSLVLGPAPFLGRQGVGLANALYNLSVEHGAIWAELEQSFRSEFPFVRRVVFPPDPAGSKIAFAIEDERFPQRKVFASEMSDGMVAYLVLLVAILQPMQVGILGLDEPDATIHPTALRRLLELAQRPHEKRRLAIVTHSNALLDGLRDPAKQVRIVEGGPEGAIVKSLDAEALAAWRTEYALSDLRRMGLVDRPNTAQRMSEPANESPPAKPRRRAAKH